MSSQQFIQIAGEASSILSAGLFGKLSKKPLRFGGTDKRVPLSFFQRKRDNFCNMPLNIFWLFLRLLKDFPQFINHIYPPFVSALRHSVYHDQNLPNASWLF